MTSRHVSSSEVSYRRLFAVSPTPLLVLAPDAPRFTIMEVNAAYLTATMTTREGLIGRALFDAFPDNPDDVGVDGVKVLRTSLGRALATLAADAVLDLQYDIARPDGPFEQRWWNALNVPVLNERGEVEAIIHQATDVTQQRRAERALRVSEARLRFLDRLAEGTQPLSDATEVMAVTTRLLGEHVGVAVCAYADMEPDQDGFTIRGDWTAPGAPTIVGTYSLADFGDRAVRELRAGRPLVLRDTLAELGPEQAALFLQLGLRATVCMPLVKEGRLVALMAVHAAEPHDWTPDELSLVADTVQRSWAHIERTRSQAGLRESEARFRSAVQAVQGVLWTNDVAGRMTGDQPGWESLTGQTRDQYQGFGWTKAVHPEDAQATEEAWLAAVAARRTFVHEHRVRRSLDGAWRVFSVRAIPAIGDDGTVREWVGVHTDVTDQRKAEAGLRDLNETLERRIAQALAERKLLADIVEGTDAFVQVLDANFRWLAINRAATVEFERIYGVRPRIGARMPDLLEHMPEHRAAVEAVWGRALAGEEFTEVGEFGDPARDRRAYEMRYNTLRGPGGERIGAYQFVHDVTERLQEQRRLAEAEAALRQSQKMEAVGQLTGGVAHDFNNLLTIIKSSTDFLRNPALPDERRRRYVEAISDTVDRAAKLTGQLLAFARRQPHKREVFDVAGRVRAMVEMLGTIVGSRIDIVADVPPEPCFVETDAAQFDTALVNMAVNARDAMQEEGTLTIHVRAVDGAPRIRGKAASAGPYVAIAVADTGVGIPPNSLSRIFEPFYTTKEVGKGTGLGLSQTYGFVKQSGGDIAVDSEVGRGTTFVLYLPEVARPAEAIDEQAALDPEPPREGHGRRVLVVEDNAEVGAFSTQLLQDLGYDTTWAANADEALRLIKDVKGFDAVFSDVVMPGMGGVELAREIRRRHPNLPVVLTSGYSHVLAEEGRHGFELLQKPYAAEELSRILNRATRGRQDH